MHLAIFVGLTILFAVTTAGAVETQFSSRDARGDLSNEPPSMGGQIPPLRQPDIATPQNSHQSAEGRVALTPERIAFLQSQNAYFARSLNAYISQYGASEPTSSEPRSNNARAEYRHIQAYCHSMLEFHLSEYRNARLESSPGLYDKFRRVMERMKKIDEAFDARRAVPGESSSSHNARSISRRSAPSNDQGILDALVFQAALLEVHADYINDFLRRGHLPFPGLPALPVVVTQAEIEFRFNRDHFQVTATRYRRLVPTFAHVSPVSVARLDRAVARIEQINDAYQNGHEVPAQVHRGQALVRRSLYAQSGTILELATSIERFNQVHDSYLREFFWFDRPSARRMPESIKSGVKAEFLRNHRLFLDKATSCRRVVPRYLHKYPEATVRLQSVLDRMERIERDYEHRGAIFSPNLHRRALSPRSASRADIMIHRAMLQVMTLNIHHAIYINAFLRYVHLEPEREANYLFYRARFRGYLIRFQDIVHTANRVSPDSRVLLERALARMIQIDQAYQQRRTVPPID